MQNNVTELTQKLRRSLDANYNVVDMVAVIDVITSLERIAITKEQLEDTRLGRYVNELRRKTSNQNLAKRAKELVKKWRNSVIPDSNGQVKQTTENNKKKRPLGGALGDNKADVAAAALLAKRSRLNGGITELDLSDNSNSSFKDVFANAEALRKDVIMINSDSNSSIADGKHDPLLEQQLPKKRGRKKGSKNHKNLLEEAESSFSNKMAVSRGNAKVKTTQELIASLQNRSSVGQNATNQNAASKLREDLNEKAAKLTERVSIIDQKLYSTNSNNFRNRKRSSLTNLKGERILESGVVTNIKPEEDSKDADEEIIVVDDDPKHQSQISAKEEPPEGALSGGSAPDFPKSLSLEEALRLLPPVDPSSLHEVGPDEGPACTCVLKENKPDFSVDAEEEEVDERPPERFEFVEDCRCPAAEHLDQRYRRTEVSEESVRRLLTTDIPGVNGNYGLGPPMGTAEPSDGGLYASVVPNRSAERIPRGRSDFDGDDFKKYRISEEEEGGAESRCFREWHECVDTPSYNGDVLRILPYVIID